MKYLPIIGSILLLVLLVRVFRHKIVGFLLHLRGKLHLQSLRTAINEADKDKADTGRKNMVLPDSTMGQFEPYQKKVLKAVAKNNRNKNNAKMTPGRKRYLSMNKKEKGTITMDRVKELENKSLYVTN